MKTKIVQEMKEFRMIEMRRGCVKEEKKSMKIMIACMIVIMIWCMIVTSE